MYSDPGCGHLLGNPLGSGLPLFIENIPLSDPGLPIADRRRGQFSFSPREQKIYYRPHPHDLSSDGKTFLATVVAPIAEGLIAAVGLSNARFTGIEFKYSAWNVPSTGVGFMDQQDGLTSVGDGHLPGGLDCTNCSDVLVEDCSFRKMGGSGVTFGGVAKRISMTMLDVSDVSGNGIMVGGHGNDTAEFQSVHNVVSDCVVEYAAQEFTGCVAVYAGYNLGLLLTHNTVTDLPYGGFSVGAGAARAGYARDNVLSFNRVERWMGKMQDSAAIYVTGRQPGSINGSVQLEEQQL